MYVLTFDVQCMERSEAVVINRVLFFRDVRVPDDLACRVDVNSEDRVVIIVIGSGSSSVPGPGRYDLHELFFGQDHRSRRRAYRKRT